MIVWCGLGLIVAIVLELWAIVAICQRIVPRIGKLLFYPEAFEGGGLHLLPFPCPRCRKDVMTWTHVEECKGTAQKK